MQGFWGLWIDSEQEMLLTTRVILTKARLTAIPAEWLIVILNSRRIHRRDLADVLGRQCRRVRRKTEGWQVFGVVLALDDSLQGEGEVNEGKTRIATRVKIIIYGFNYIFNYICTSVGIILF